MLHLHWHNRSTERTVTCIHTNATKYTVSRSLTAGKPYPVVNETDEFYFVIDNSGKVGGFYKDYFE